jgi:hypothetical protein
MSDVLDDQDDLTIAYTLGFERAKAEAAAEITALRAALASAIKERDEARARFNDIDLCKMGQAPCNALLAATAESDRLRRALEPFANDWRAFPGCDPDGEPTKVTVADFQRARQALKEQTP